MNITREVITDLLPLYLAGEASQDSQILVRKFFEQDPEFAQLVEKSTQDDLTSYTVTSPSNELSILEKTKRLINLRSWLMGASLFFTASLFGIRDVGNGVEWIWAGLPWAFSICLALAAGSWVAYGVIRYRLDHVGL